MPIATTYEPPEKDVSTEADAPVVKDEGPCDDPGLKWCEEEQQCIPTGDECGKKEEKEEEEKPGTIYTGAKVPNPYYRDEYDEVVEGELKDIPADELEARRKADGTYKAPDIEDVEKEEVSLDEMYEDILDEEPDSSVDNITEILKPNRKVTVEDLDAEAEEIFGEGVDVVGIPTNIKERQESIYNDFKTKSEEVLGMSLEDIPKNEKGEMVIDDPEKLKSAQILLDEYNLNIQELKKLNKIGNKLIKDYNKNIKYKKNKIDRAKQLSKNKDKAQVLYFVKLSEEEKQQKQIQNNQNALTWEKENPNADPINNPWVGLAVQDTKLKAIYNYKDLEQKYVKSGEYNSLEDWAAKMNEGWGYDAVSVVNPLEEIVVKSTSNIIRQDEINKKDKSVTDNYWENLLTGWHKGKDLSDVKGQSYEEDISKWIFRKEEKHAYNYIKHFLPDKFKITETTAGFDYLEIEAPNGETVELGFDYHPDQEITLSNGNIVNALEYNRNKLVAFLERNASDVAQIRQSKKRIRKALERYDKIMSTTVEEGGMKVSDIKMSEFREAASWYLRYLHLDFQEPGLMEWDFGAPTILGGKPSWVEPLVREILDKYGETAVGFRYPLDQPWYNEVFEAVVEKQKEKYLEDATDEFIEEGKWYRKEIDIQGILRFASSYKIKKQLHDAIEWAFKTNEALQNLKDFTDKGCYYTKQFEKFINANPDTADQIVAYDDNTGEYTNFKNQEFVYKWEEFEPFYEINGGKCPKIIYDKAVNEAKEYRRLKSRIEYLKQRTEAATENIDELDARWKAFQLNYNLWEKTYEGLGWETLDLVLSIVYAASKIGSYLDPTQLTLNHLYPSGPRKIVTEVYKAYRIFTDEDMEFEQFRNTPAFGDIENIWDFGEYMSGTVVTQLPLIVLMIAATVATDGAINPAVWAALTGYGKKDIEMNLQNDALRASGFKTYSEWEIFWKSIGYGVAEGAFAYLSTAPILLQGNKILRGIKNPRLKGEVYKHRGDFFIRNFTGKTGVAVMTASEVACENATTICQNLIDGRHPFENLGETTVVSLAYGFTMSASPVITATILTNFASSSELHALRENINKVQKALDENKQLEEQLEILKQQYDGLKIKDKQSIGYQEYLNRIKEIKKQIENNNRLREMALETMGQTQTEIENRLYEEGINENALEYYTDALIDAHNVRQLYKDIITNPDLDINQKKEKVKEFELRYQSMMGLMEMFRDKNGPFNSGYVALEASSIFDRINGKKRKRLNDIKTKAKQRIRDKKGDNHEITDSEIRAEGIKIYNEEEFDAQDVRNIKLVEILNKKGFNFDYRSVNTIEDFVNEITKFYDDLIEEAWNYGNVDTDKFKREKKILEDRRNDAISRISSGDYNGFYDDRYDVQWVVRENSVKNDRPYTTLHEPAHKLAIEILKENPRAFKDLSTQILQYVQEYQPKLYTKWVFEQDLGDKGRINHDEVIAAFFESIDKIDLKKIDHFVNQLGLLWNEGLKNATDGEYWMDLAGSNQILKIFTDIGVKLKSGELTVEDIYAAKAKVGEKPTTLTVPDIVATQESVYYSSVKEAVSAKQKALKEIQDIVAKAKLAQNTTSPTYSKEQEDELTALRKIVSDANKVIKPIPIQKYKKDESDRARKERVNETYEDHLKGADDIVTTRNGLPYKQIWAGYRDKIISIAYKRNLLNTPKYQNLTKKQREQTIYDAASIPFMKHVRNFDHTKNDDFDGWIMAYLYKKIVLEGHKSLPVIENFSKTIDDLSAAEIAELVTTQDIIEEIDIATAKIENIVESTLRKKLGISKGDPLYNEVLETIKGIYKAKDLPDVTSYEFKNTVENIIEEKLRLPIQKLLGRGDKYEQFLKDNWDVVKDLHISKLVELERLKKPEDRIFTEVVLEKMSVEETRIAEKEGRYVVKSETAGNTLYIKKDFTKDDVVNFFLLRGTEAINKKTGKPYAESTKGTRKDALAGGLTVEIGLDAFMQIAQDPAFVNKLKENQKLQGFKPVSDYIAAIATRIERDRDVYFSTTFKAQPRDVQLRIAHVISGVDFQEKANERRIRGDKDWFINTLMQSVPKADFENRAKLKNIGKEFQREFDKVTSLGTWKDFSGIQLKVYEEEAEIGIFSTLEAIAADKEIVIETGTTAINTLDKLNAARVQIINLLNGLIEDGTFTKEEVNKYILPAFTSPARLGQWETTNDDFGAELTESDVKLHGHGKRLSLFRNVEDGRRQLGIEESLGDRIRDRVNDLKNETNPDTNKKYTEKEAIEIVKKEWKVPSKINSHKEWYTQRFTKADKAKYGVEYFDELPLEKRIEYVRNEIQPEGLKAKKILKKLVEKLREAYVNNEIDEQGAATITEIIYGPDAMDALGKIASDIRYIPTMTRSEIIDLYKLDANDPFVLEHTLPAQKMKRYTYNYIISDPSKVNKAKEIFDKELEVYSSAIIPDAVDKNVNFTGKEFDNKGTYLKIETPGIRKPGTHTLEEGTRYKDDNIPLIDIDTDKVYFEEEGLITELQNGDGLDVLNAVNQTDADNTIFDLDTENKKLYGFDADDVLIETGDKVRVVGPPELADQGYPLSDNKVVIIIGPSGGYKTTNMEKLGLTDQGFSPINQDFFVEKLKKEAGLPTDETNYTTRQRSIRASIGAKAKKLADAELEKLSDEGKGLTLDLTGASTKATDRKIQDLEDKGYDVLILFSGGSLESSLEANRKRKERRLKDFIVTNNWNQVNESKQYYKDRYKDNFVEIDTDKQGIADPVPAEVEIRTNSFTQGYVKAQLDPKAYADKAAELEEAGADFDFSDFDKPSDIKEGKMVVVAKNIVDKHGSENVKVITARNAEAAPYIKLFLASVGLGDVDVFGVGSSDPQAKVDVINALIAQDGYNEVYFADDSKPNVDAVEKDLTEQDITHRTQHVKYSRTLDKDFNEILERVSGIPYYKRYSRITAQEEGKRKGKFKFFIPPSAEDFVGLMYPNLGKGEQGNKDMQWLKDNLLDPYAKGYTALNFDQSALLNDYSTLVKKLKGKKGWFYKHPLTQKVYKNFTNEEVARILAWDKQGITIDGLSKTDLNAIRKIGKDNLELDVFAGQLIAINKGDGYAYPGGNWRTGNITGDLTHGLSTTKRNKYMQQFIQNADIIFSEENLNKLEAIHGAKYREALENMLDRMKRGSNRPQNAGRLERQINNWVNNSVGVVMFYNMRSAVLQTISMINYSNWNFNNPAKMAIAFANQPRFWKDFMHLFNSDFLVARRKGLKINVAESEIADALDGQSNKAAAFVNLLLRKGFKPTQIADSFAIAFGGATYYRNRINDLKKKTNPDTNKKYTESEAEVISKREWKEISEENQQSSRPDKISMQQASGAGRVILAFANTPLQYNRLIKKATQDLINGRGDWKHNVSKIIYYLFVQNLIFNALQQAIFAIVNDDEMSDDEKEKYYDIANGMLDSTLRGLGVGGAIVSTLKNVGLDIYERSQSDSWKGPQFEKSALKMFDVAPPLDIKLSQLTQAASNWEYNKDKPEASNPWDINNPIYESVAKVIAATTNAPLNRLFQKMENVKGALDANNAWWKRVAMLFGWPEWQLESPSEQSIRVEEDKKIRLETKAKVKPSLYTKEEQENILKQIGYSDEEIKAMKNEDSRVAAILKAQRENNKIYTPSEYDENRFKSKEEKKKEEIEESLKLYDEPTEPKKNDDWKIKKVNPVKELEKNIFNLNANEQHDLLIELEILQRHPTTEPERVEQIVNEYKRNPDKVNKALKKLSKYKSSKEGKRKKEINDMNKAEQVNLLLRLGLTAKQIRALTYERDRVNKIYELENK